MVHDRQEREVVGENMRHDSRAGGSTVSPSSAQRPTSAATQSSPDKWTQDTFPQSPAPCADARRTLRPMTPRPAPQATQKGQGQHAFAIWLDSMDQGSIMLHVVQVVCQCENSWAIGILQSSNANFRQLVSLPRTPASDAQDPTKVSLLALFGKTVLTLS